MLVPTIGQLDFTEKVLRSKEPFLLAFRARACVASQRLVPIIEKVASDYQGRVNFAAVEADSDSSISRRLGVKRLPVIMMISDGKVVDFIGGTTDEKNISDMVARRLEPVIDVGEHNFDVEVLQSSLPTLVHFFAPWCRASLDMVPLVREIGERFRYKAKVVRVEFGSQSSRLCAQYRVLRVPTTLLFVDGVIQDELLGAGAKDESSPSAGLTIANTITQMLNQFVH
jgi:thioredoxin 1